MADILWQRAQDLRVAARRGVTFKVPAPSSKSAAACPHDPNHANPAGGLMKRTFAAFAAVLILTSCSDKNDPMASSGDKLTRSEALAIANSVDASTSGTASTTPAGLRTADFANSTPTDVTVHTETSFPCPASGRINVKLDLSLAASFEERTFRLDTEGKLDHDHCGFPHDGITLTVDGDPDLSFEAHAGVTNGAALDLSSSAKGAVNWTASDGRSGHCGLDITTTTDFAAKKRTTAGQVCGVTINETVSWK